MSLRPFFSYFGGKHRAARRYPAPQYRQIVEPFAGSAGYATRYYGRDVLLVDKSEIIAGIWSYLIRVQPAEILALPDIAPETTVEDYPLTQEQRWLIGFWLAGGRPAPGKRPSPWLSISQGTNKDSAFWGVKARQRIASQVQHIRHWRVLCGTYEDASRAIPGPATWFVDPPYQVAGKHYPHGAAAIDFDHLSAWCRSLRGQVMVCENDGADWLPFLQIGGIAGTPGKARTGKSAEVVWYGGEA